jgi:hypothetical protein
MGGLCIVAIGPVSNSILVEQRLKAQTSPPGGALCADGRGRGITAVHHPPIDA